MTKYSGATLCEAHKDKKNRFLQAAESGLAKQYVRQKKLSYGALQGKRHIEPLRAAVRRGGKAVVLITEGGIIRN